MAVLCNYWIYLHILLFQPSRRQHKDTFDFFLFRDFHRRCCSDGVLVPIQTWVWCGVCGSGCHGVWWVLSWAHCDAPLLSVLPSNLKCSRYLCTYAKMHLLWRMFFCSKIFKWSERGGSLPRLSNWCRHSCFKRICGKVGFQKQKSTCVAHIWNRAFLPSPVRTTKTVFSWQA